MVDLPQSLNVVIYCNNIHEFHPIVVAVIIKQYNILVIIEYVQILIRINTDIDVVLITLQDLKKVSRSQLWLISVNMFFSVPYYK